MKSIKCNNRKLFYFVAKMETLSRLESLSLSRSHSENTNPQQLQFMSSVMLWPFITMKLGEVRVVITTITADGVTFYTKSEADIN